jgi:hypothetical protein
MKTNTNTLRSLLLAFAGLLPLLVHAQWVSNGRDAMFTMYLPQAKKPDTHAIFVVSYEKRWSCRPAISVMLMTGRKLGAPKHQVTERKREDQLSIVIDGRVFTDETKVTMYSNAMELAMFAPPGFIEAMKKPPSSVIVRVGAGLGGFDFSDGRDFAAANAAAATNCN